MSSKPSPCSSTSSESSVSELEQELRISPTSVPKPYIIDDGFKTVFYDGDFGNKNIQDHCVYVGSCQSIKSAGSRTAVAACNYCDKKIKYPINNAYNWERHVTVRHNVTFE